MQTPKYAKKKKIKICDIDNKNNLKVVDSFLKTCYNSINKWGAVIPLRMRILDMNKLVKFLVALTDPEIMGAVGVVVGLIVACMVGGH